VTARSIANVLRGHNHRKAAGTNSHNAVVLPILRTVRSTIASGSPRHMATGSGLLGVGEMSRMVLSFLERPSYLPTIT
jgi:hypothetical protein